MIRVTVEILPHGSEARKRVLAVGEIANDGTGTLQRGNYTFKLSKVRWLTSVSREGEVKNFPRRAKNVWHLVREVLNVAFK